MKKKLITMLIAGAVFLVGCGDNTTNNTTNNAANNTPNNSVTEIIVVDTTISSEIGRASCRERV